MKTYKSEFLGLCSAIGLLGFLAFAPGAHADSHPGPAMDGPRLPGAELMRERMADRLELDDTQRQQIANILEAARPEFEALRERVQGEIDAVLTDEQREKLENSRARMRDGRGRRGRDQDDQ